MIKKKGGKALPKSLLNDLSRAQCITINLKSRNIELQFLNWVDEEKRASYRILISAFIFSQTQIKAKHFQKIIFKQFIIKLHEMPFTVDSTYQ